MLIQGCYFILHILVCVKYVLLRTMQAVHGRLELTEGRREVKPPAVQGGGGQAGVRGGTAEAHPCRAVAEKCSMGPQGRKKAEISLHLSPGEQNGNLGVWERK